MCASSYTSVINYWRNDCLRQSVGNRTLSFTEINNEYSQRCNQVLSSALICLYINTYYCVLKANIEVFRQIECTNNYSMSIRIPNYYSDPETVDFPSKSQLC